MGRFSNSIKHLIANLTRRYYFEDYVRVYPGGIRFNKHGRKFQAKRIDIKNFLNHAKF